MKNRVPAAPQPTFGDATALSSENIFSRFAGASRSTSTSRAAASFPLLAPLGEGFLNRTSIVTLLFAALLTICVGAATSSPLAAGSFVAGAVLSVVLLKSQQWFVRRIVALKSKNRIGYQGRDAKLPLWLLVPVKYLAIAGLIYFGLRSKLLVPEYFVAGFTTLQVIIFARVGGILLKAGLKPVDQVYIRNAKNN